MSEDNRSGTRAATTARLVDFENPPVVETVMGLQFAPLPGWNIVHFGLLWNLIRDEYPRFQVQPPIGSEIELKFDVSAANAPVPSVEMSGWPVRCWFFDRSETRLIQIQSNCFIHNWRKTTATKNYEHYEVIKPIFSCEWNRFVDFLKRNEIAAPEVWQCEVTYVNHLERGVGWDSFSDLPSVLPSWSGQASGDFLPKPEVVFLNVGYPMPNNSGRLQIVAQPAIRQSDGKEVLQLTLTARGQPKSSAHEDLLKWLDLGHEWVVRGFKDFTSRKMHGVWGIK